MNATDIMLYILLGVGVLGLILSIFQLFKIRVWISIKNKRNQKFTKIGFLDLNDQYEVPEVRLPDQTRGTPIGRVKMGDKDDNSYVEVLLTDSDDESVKPRYKTCGYVTQEGYIYKLGEKGKKAERIGYTARPSNPEVPTTIGERSWKTLWLTCKLNVYLGSPNPPAPEQTAEEGKEEDKKAGKAGKAKTKVSSRIPEVKTSYTGIHSSKHDSLPPEAKAGAYGVFFQMYNKNDYYEHYASPAYGWKDTALLSAFIYAVLYVVWYIFKVKILGLRFIGFKYWLDIPLYFVFYALWAIVRAIKIECIERSDTIQPQLDIFNKSLGQKWIDTAIIICCSIILGFTGTYYRFDFLPLATVIMTAVGINMSLKASKKPWETNNPYEADKEESEEDELENPRGDIERDYAWDLDSPDRKDVKGNLTLYFDSQYISELRFMNPFFSQRKDKSTHVLIKEMFRYIKSHKSVSARSRYIVKRIEELSRQNGLAADDKMQFMLDFVQEPNIRFVMNVDSSAIQKYADYIRYPDEVLYDQEADSNSKAFLAAVLVHYMKHNVLFLCSRHQHHGAIGIEVSEEWVKDGRLFDQPREDVTFTHNGREYIFCETTADGFRIGGTLGGMNPDDFDERVEIPVIDENIDDTNEDSETRLYHWELDSAMGNKLVGSTTIEFSMDELGALRSDNPFNTYGTDGHSYADNVRAMFEYLDKTPGVKKHVEEIASYIRSEIKSMGYGELDLVQFALDFCQEPNITYRVDEESEGIEFAKEYMRFPDEVLYDKEGDCDCKSSLTMALLKALGYKVVFLLSQKHSHAAVGVEYDPEWKDFLKIEDEERVVKEHNGVKYVYCETTGDNFKVGQIGESQSIQDFEFVEV